jgi:hypothetical protein
MSLPCWQGVRYPSSSDAPILTSAVTAIFDTTNTRTTNSSILPSTHHPTHSEVSHFCPSAALTCTKMRSFAPSRPSTIPTLSLSPSSCRADLRCSRATSTHLRPVSSRAQRHRSGSAARQHYLQRSRWRAYTMARPPRRFLPTSSHHNRLSPSFRPRKLSRQRQHQSQPLRPLHLVDRHHR